MSFESDYNHKHSRNTVLKPFAIPLLNWILILNSSKFSTLETYDGCYDHNDRFDCVDVLNCQIQHYYEYSCLLPKLVTKNVV